METRDSEAPLQPASPGTGKAPARRFGDEEIARILRAAIDLQDRAATVSDDAERGLTLEEIRQVAREAGIDPRFVDLAARGEDRSSPMPHGAFGAPTQWYLSGSVDGEVPEEGRDRIIHAIRSLMGAKGELAEQWGRVEWSASDGVGTSIVGVASRGGRTEVDVSAVRTEEAAVLQVLGTFVGGIVGGAALGTGLGLSGAAVLPVIAGMAATSFGLGRLAWRARAKWWERKLQAVLSTVTEVVEGVAVHPSAALPEADAGDGAGPSHEAPPSA